MSEIRIHRSLNHSSIVGFESFFEDSDNVYILLELCQNQTLNELLKRRKKLTELETQCYVMHIIEGLKYLHSKRIIHRDLKLGNLFLNADMEQKIGDFGLATKLQFDGDRKRTLCGTPNYIAPEVLDEKQGHSYEVDIWSLGVVIYALLIGKLPFEAADIKSTYKRIKMNAYLFPDKTEISLQAKDLIAKILNSDPYKRPTLDQILEHPFLHTENVIPRTMPPSTLAHPPSASFIRQYPQSSDKLRLDKVTTLNRVIEINNKNVSSSTKNDNKIGEKDIWIKKWVDYTSKYGIGTIRF